MTTPQPKSKKRKRPTAAAMEEGLSQILNHAGIGIECCDEAGATRLREICEIVDGVFGIDTSEHETE